MKKTIKKEGVTKFVKEEVHLKKLYFKSLMISFILQITFYR